LDTFQVYDNEILLRNVINSDVIILCEEEAVQPTPKPLNIQAIVEYELFSLANETGVITNIGTTFANQSNEQNKGNPTQYSFECAISKILQGEIIDSQKSQIPVFIPNVLKETAKYKPYFMINIDFGSPKSYQTREYVQCNCIIGQFKTDRYSSYLCVHLRSVVEFKVNAISITVEMSQTLM
jgi:hypothetical protein